MLFFLLPFIAISQVNEFEGEVKFSNLKSNKQASSLLIQNEDGTVGRRSIESLQIPKLEVSDYKLEIILNDEAFLIDLSQASMINPADLIRSFELNGTILELGLFNHSEKLKVDLSELVKTNFKNLNEGFATAAGVTSNSPGNPDMDDLVFGSTQLDDAAGTLEDSRMFFDKGASAFRAGRVAGTQWNNANLGVRSAAFGYNNTAKGANSFATGEENIAMGANSAVFGKSSVAMGSRSFAAGNHLWQHRQLRFP